MAAIHQNLKRMRQERGLTQEEVAVQLHVTRQTISGYEAGRTQPDLDTLTRLAEVYHVDISELLYGSGRREREWKRLRMTALVSLILTAACGVVSSGALWLANTRYWIAGSGQFGTQEQAAFYIRQQLDAVRTAGESVGVVSARVCCLLLLILFAMADRPPSRGKVWAWLGWFTLCSLGIVLPFALMDPHFAPVNYLAAPLWSVALGALTAAVSEAVRAVKRKG